MEYSVEEGHDHLKLQALSIVPHKRRTRNLVSFLYRQDQITTFVETGPEILRRRQSGIPLFVCLLPLARLRGARGCAGLLPSHVSRVCLLSRACFQEPHSLQAVAKGGKVLE